MNSKYYNIGVVTAPDFVTVQESVESKDYYANKIYDRIDNLRDEFGEVCIHLTTQRKLDVFLASGLFHANTPYEVYHPFNITINFYQTEKERNFKAMQIYSSGAQSNNLVFNTRYNPENILKVWQEKFAKMDKILYVGPENYLNRLDLDMAKVEVVD